ncbi:hypothetical protein HH212_26120 [Massilia forsythiae]|uniref:Uncharacterized protein n=1 Tax=Massilia forsythiae TaxID=2728020 RepID=A0A7Z2W188_9BURK|nr:hypothetical protein [Massilia forsythiae]QJE03036.1 hypothetical protein HH212_26120 [Massilia forsythiae]
MNPQWKEEAARLGGPALVQVLAELRDGQLELMARADILDGKVTKLDASTNRLLSGFPANDVEGHRRYHESVIEWRELRNKLVREALTKAAGATVMAGLGWVLMALWQAVVTTVNK